MKKMKEDISFIDPKTMQVRCTFNGCVDKFSVEEDFEVSVIKNGRYSLTSFHTCNECGQRINSSGKSRRAYKKWLEVKNLHHEDPEDRQESA